MRRTHLAAGALLIARVAAAGSPGTPGPSDAPREKARVYAARSPSNEDLGQRRAIRGETVDGHESDELRALRAFENDRFGKGRLREIGDENSSPSDTTPAIAAGLSLPDLPVRWDARVLRFLDFYKNERRGRSIMGAWLKRQGRYRDLIEASLDRARLPRALLYVSMIESGYDPRDSSSAGAAGLWQFMPEGGRIYGLREDYWVDERNDPEKSTDAVMRYFADLKTRFGSWHLALAAFNAGYGAVLASAAKYNTNDYWRLCRLEDGLPWETVQYVPKVLATAIVGENRAAFGFDEVKPAPPLTFDRVSVPPSTTLANVARFAGVSLESVAALNPELRRDRTPPAVAGSEPWLVRLPRGTGPRFMALFEPSRERLRPYLVVPGDRLETIAKAFATSTKELKRMNTIRDLQEVRPGVTLVVPDRGLPKGAAAAKNEAESQPAQIVALPDAVDAVEGTKRVFYRVAPGDGTAEIARFFGVSEADVLRWNQLDPDARLLSGLVLRLFVAEGFDEKLALDPAHLKLVTAGTEEFFDLVETRRGRKRIAYTVRAGDTMKRIAQRFGLTEADLERINRTPRQADLAPGQTLTIYVPMTPNGTNEGGTADGEAPLPSLPSGEALALPSVPASAFTASPLTKVDAGDAPAAPLPPPPAPPDDPAIAPIDRSDLTETSVDINAAAVVKIELPVGRASPAAGGKLQAARARRPAPLADLTTTNAAAGDAPVANAE